MGQGSRPERVADQIRAEVTTMIARELHDPGVGFVTVTRVQVSPDLQHARVFYTSLGDAAARKNTARALERAAGFMRHQIGKRLRLRRAPEVTFVFDESIGHQDRVEQLLKEIANAPSGPSSAPVGATTGKPDAPVAPDAPIVPVASDIPDTDDR
jgi:ribosome-binding factor A